MKKYEYFNESYFQDGKSKGTVYSNYLAASRTSKIYKEIVDALIYIYKPKRVLEIGCATGIMVKYFNEAGIEAHGIDVSDWAIKNREHKNVILTSASELPYETNYFDLVFSCHSIEHIPEEYFKDSLKEISRVCSNFQVHLLPIVGTHPYIGDPELISKYLKKDPTHNQLHSKVFWINSFKPFNFTNIPLNIMFKSDGERSEITYSQFSLHKEGLTIEPEIIERLNEWNLSVYQSLNSQRNELLTEIIIQNDLLLLDPVADSWVDFKANLIKNKLQTKLVLFTFSDSNNDSNIRVALSDNTTDKDGNYLNVLEKQITVKKGYTINIIDLEDFSLLRGNLKICDASIILLGGMLKSQVKFYLVNQDNELIVNTEV